MNYVHVINGAIDTVSDEPISLQMEVEPPVIKRQIISEREVDKETGITIKEAVYDDVIVKDAVFKTLPGKIVETELEVTPLWFYDGKNFIPPPKAKPIDTHLNRLQFNAMTRILGVSIDAIKTVVESTIQDPFQQAVAIARIEETQSFHRDNPLFELLGPALQMTDEQIDQAWETALAIE